MPSILGSGVNEAAASWMSTPGGIRTPDTWFRRPVLYPLSYGRTG